SPPPARGRRRRPRPRRAPRGDRLRLPVAPLRPRRRRAGPPARGGQALPVRGGAGVPGGALAGLGPDPGDPGRAARARRGRGLRGRPLRPRRRAAPPLGRRREGRRSAHSGPRALPPDPRSPLARERIMTLASKDLLRRLGAGESIASACAAAGLARPEFDAWRAAET